MRKSPISSFVRRRLTAYKPVDMLTAPILAIFN